MAMLCVALVAAAVACGDAEALVQPDDLDDQVDVALVEVQADSTLVVGDSAEFSARVLDSEGNELDDPDISWSSEDPAVASVNTLGLVRALASGEVVITAAVEEKRDSADVRIVEEDTDGDDPPSDDDDPPSDDDADPWPNEPESFRVMTERSFDHPSEEGWTASNSFEVVQESDLPRSESTTGHIPFHAGFEGGRTTGWTTRDGLDSFGHRDLYISFWLKLSDNWQDSDGSGVSKIGFFWVNDDPVVFPMYWTYKGGAMRPQIRVQDTPVGTQILEANLGGLTPERGQWHRWEIVLRMNTGDSLDGEAHWWIDGVKVGEHTDVIFSGADGGKVWQIAAWRPTWGNTEDVVEETMHAWMDHIYVSGGE